MSLLLDALKKAAEKKAKKSAEEAKGIENTQVAPEGIRQSAHRSDEAATHETGAADSTRTQPYGDRTRIDPTEIDKTEIDSTDLDITDIAASEIDNTDIDSTDIRTTALDMTDIETTHIDQTELDITDIAASDDDRTDIDSTDIKTTALNMKGIAATHTGDTEHDGDGDDQLTNTIADITDSQTLTEEDKTLLFYEDDEDDVEIDVTRAHDDKTETQVTDTQGIYPRRSQQDRDILTPDDVTEFMGDGLTAKEVEENSIPREDLNHLGTDDTTLTNRDLPGRTNIDYEDLTLEQQEDTSYPVAEDDTRTYTSAQDGYDDRISSDPDPQDYQLEDISERGHTTVSNAEATSSTIDIERLTSDETVTIKDSTATRTFAPDNYDRTLLKLADTDVSKIFPGVKPETDTVMTPDYAKKVFLNKSQGVKHSSYKVYGGVALLILITVSVLGLFELQDESDLIDRSLLGLKRDPMPGIINPRSTEESVILFPTESVTGNGKVIDIIASADAGSGPVSDALTEAQTMDTKKSDDNKQVQEDSSSIQQQASAGSGSLETDRRTDSEITAPPAKQPQQTVAATTGKPKQAVSASKDAGLQITTTSRVSDKDRKLVSAYEAYEAGDLTVAGRLYDQVLSLEPQNRDALLGRAAIFVKQNAAEKAIRLYQQLLELNPKDSVAMTSLISVVNIDPQAGETQIKNLLREQPDSPYLHFTLGNMYGSQKRWSEAQSAYFTALQHKPRDPNYAYNLAVSLEHMRKPDTAITFYQRALANNAYGQATFDSQLVGQRIEVLSQ